MLARYFTNQVAIADASATTTFTSDPVGVGEDSVGEGVITVHTINGTSPSFKLFVELSNDGAHWHTDSTAIYTDTTGTIGTFATGTVPAGAALSRIKVEAIGGSTLLYVIFDFSVRYYSP